VPFYIVLRYIPHLAILGVSLMLLSCAATPSHTLSTACATHGNGDWGAMVRACEQDVREDPENDTAYELIAAAQYTLGDDQHALENINNAINLNHDLTGYYVERCRIEIALEQYHAAISDCTTAIDRGVNPESWANLAYEARAVGELNLGMYGDAKTDLDTSIRDNPRYLEAYELRCKVLFLDAQYSDALSSCIHYLQAPSNHENFLYYWTMAYTGASYWQLNQFNKARPYAQWLIGKQPRLMQHFSESHELDVFNLKLRREKTDALIAQAELEESIMDWGKAFDLYNDAASYAMGYTPSDQAIVTKIQGKLTMLYPQLQKKPALPELAHQYQVEADTYFRNQDYLAAINAYVSAYSIAPWSPLISYNLALLYAHQKDYQDAIRFMNSYVTLVPDAPDVTQARDRIYEWTADAESSG
jgi:tetratricopeptide (TPR) repeat protein